MEEAKIIETERMIVRYPKLSDADDLREGLDNINVSKWLMCIEHPFDISNSQEMVKKALKQMKEIGDRHFVFELKKTGKVIGNLRIGVLDAVGDICGHIHWDYQKQGYFQEAIEPIFDMLFKAGVVKEITWFIVEGNDAHRKIAENFEFEIIPTDDSINLTTAMSTGKKHKLSKAYLTKAKWRKQQLKKGKTLS